MRTRERVSTILPPVGKDKTVLRLQKLLDSRSDAIQFLRLQSAFPNDQRAPPLTTKKLANFGVAGPIAGEFGEPELFVRGGSRSTARALMAVPKAAVNEDDLAPAGEYQVGTAGNVAAVEPIAIAEARYDASDRQLRRRIARADGSHHAATLGDGKQIGHAAARRRGAVSVRREIITSTAATTPGCGGTSGSHGMPRRSPS